MKSETKAREDEASSTSQALPGQTPSNREPITKLNRAGLKMQNILVPTDFSEPSRKALRYAVSFAEEFGARITLLHVVKPVIPTHEDYPIRRVIQDDKSLVSGAENALGQLCQREGINPGWIRKALVRLGAPSEEIMKVARESQVDLIVIGTHGYTGLKHIFAGSTTERVVRHAPCPVLVVRDEEREFLSA